MSTTTTLNSAQTVALRSQIFTLVLRIEEKGDKSAHDELVNLIIQANESTGQEVVEFEFGELITRGATAYQRILDAEAEAARHQAEEVCEAEEKPAPKMSEEDRRAANRTRLAETFCQNGFIEAGAAVEMDFDTCSGREAVMATKAISQAAKQGGARRGKENWEKVAWAIFYQAKACAERGSEDQALYFLMPIIRIYLSLSCTAGQIGESILRGAESVLQNAKPSAEWSRWALEALDRLISSKEENPVNDLLRSDPQLAGVATTGEELVDCLQEAVHSAVNRHREANAKAKAGKESARRARQLERAGVCTAMRGSNSKSELVGKGRKSPRRDNDPNRRR